MANDCYADCRKSLGTMADAAAEKIGQADRVLSAMRKQNTELAFPVWDCVWQDGRMYSEVIGDALTVAQVALYTMLGAIERLSGQTRDTEG